MLLSASVLFFKSAIVLIICIPSLTDSKVFTIIAFGNGKYKWEKFMNEYEIKSRDSKDEEEEQKNRGGSCGGKSSSSSSSSDSASASSSGGGDGGGALTNGDQSDPDYSVNQMCKKVYTVYRAIPKETSCPVAMRDNLSDQFTP